MLLVMGLQSASQMEGSVAMVEQVGFCSELEGNVTLVEQVEFCSELHWFCWR